MMEITDEFFLTSEPLDTDEKSGDRSAQISSSSPKTNKSNQKVTSQTVKSPSKRSPGTPISK